MMHEFRTYRVKPGKLGEYLAAFEELALPPIRKHMHLIGFWSSDTGELNRVYHLWAFENADMRVRRFAALRADPDYQKFQPVALPLIEHMHSTLLSPVPFSGLLPLGQEPAWLPFEGSGPA